MTVRDWNSRRHRVADKLRQTKLKLLKLTSANQRGILWTRISSLNSKLLLRALTQD